MLFRFVLCFALLAIALSNVKALTKEELAAIHGSVIKFISECKEEFHITEEAFMTAKESKSGEGIDPCAIHCVLKKAKFINDEGKYNANVVKENSEQFLSNEEDKKKIAEIADACAAVNDEDVSDGDKGCERAELLLACLATYRESL